MAEQKLNLLADFPAISTQEWKDKIIADEDTVQKLVTALEQESISDKCVCCGKPAKHSIYWGVAY